MINMVAYQKWKIEVAISQIADVSQLQRSRSVTKILGVDHGSVHVDGRGVDPAVEEDGEHAGLHLGGTKPRSLTLTLAD